MFELERLIADCRAAQQRGDGQPAIRELVARAVTEPAALLSALGAPTRAGIFPLYRGDDLTMLNLVWGPGMSLMPHDHRMWAVIGIYTGREDNVFWRRAKGAPDGRVEAAGAQALSARDCTPLGKDVIHSVLNPIPRLTGALHVYGGDFFNEPRSEWDPESLRERTYNVDGVRRQFEESNVRLAS